MFGNWGEIKLEIVESIRRFVVYFGLVDELSCRVVLKAGLGECALK